MSFKPNYIENNETKILDPKTSEKKKEIFLILPMERKNRKKKKEKRKKREENLTSFDGWARSAKGGRSSVENERRPEIAIGVGNGGDLRRNEGNGRMLVGGVDGQRMQVRAGKGGKTTGTREMGRRTWWREIFGLAR
jgi:hypothetical protein